MDQVDSMVEAKEPLVVQPSEAALADQRRRAGASRAISAVFALILLPTVGLTAVTGGPRLVAVINAVATLAFATTSWMSRLPQRASKVGAAIIAIMLAQHLGISLVLTELSEAVTVAYFTGCCPLVAAATLRSRGTVVAGSLGALALVLQTALHAPRAAVVQAFWAPSTYYLTTWAVATFYSFASTRAREAHAQQESKAHAAQTAARSAEARYELMAEHMRDLLSLVDDRGGFVFASPSFQRVLGLDPAALLGRTAPEVVHVDDLQPALAAFEKARSVGASAAVARLRLGSGDYRWFHVAYSRTAASPGSVIAVSARDIHEERMLAAALEASHRMEALGRLAGGVAHDFNNLLMVMRSCTELLSGDLGTDRGPRANLELLDQAVGRATALTGHLLAFARRQVLPRNAHSKPAQTAAMLAPILTRLGGLNVHVELDAPESNREVAASSVQIEQILMNLVANAKDAIPTKGTVRISVRDRTLGPDDVAEHRPGRYVEIAVEDDGTGMTAQVKARIFEPFFTTKQSGAGTGLGLATVFGLVSQLRGHIDVHSELGKGTTFVVRLPESEPKPERGATLKGAPGDGSPGRVLIVDDDPAIRAIMLRVLGGAGFDVTEAASAANAMTAAEKEGARFDCVVTDAALGAEDGIAMLERFKLAQPHASAVVISGFAPSPDRVAVLAERGAEFLAKPFGASDLLAAITRSRAPGG